MLLTCGPAAHEGEDVLEVGHLQQHRRHCAVHGRGDAGQGYAAKWEGQPGPHRKHCTSERLLNNTVFIHCSIKIGQHLIQICILSKVKLLSDVRREQEGRSSEPTRTCCWVAD